MSFLIVLLAGGMFNSSTTEAEAKEEMNQKAMQERSASISYSNSQDKVYTPKGVLTWDFEANDGGFTAPSDWHISGGWAWANPTAGPPSAHSGSYCWGTSPSGNYDANADWTLTMPTQNFSGLGQPMLILWQWYHTETSYDSGWVEVSTDGGASWSKISQSYRGSSSGWETDTVDLSSYANTANVDIRFRFMSDGSVQYEGWYLDDISIVNRSLVGNTVLYATSFEGGDNGDLSAIIIGTASPAPWQRGTLSSGPGSAMFGTRTIATNTSSNYNSNADEVMQKNSVINTSAYSYIEMSFWHWFDTETGYDSGWVEVSTDGGTSWTQASPTYRGHDSTWYHAALDLSSYASANFLFRFRFKSDGSVQYDGWYVDSVRISGATSVNYTTVSSWDFEADSGNYTANPAAGWVDRNEWEWGVPMAAVGAHSGARCWATDLDDTYDTAATMILLGPTTDVSNTSSWPNVILDFWHHMDISSSDTCFVQVSSDGGTNWNKVETYTTSFAGWRAESLNVTGYRGANFTFRFVLKVSSTSPDTGWYIDDVELDTVVPNLQQVSVDPVYVSQGYVAGYIDNGSSEAGTYTAATDTLHARGSDISLLYGGNSHNPWSSYLTVRSYATNTDYVSRDAGSSTNAPFSVVELQPYYMGTFRIHGNEDSLVSIWDGLPEDLRIEQHIYALGNTQEDSRLQIMTKVINNASVNRTVSVRYQWDIHINTSDDPFIRAYIGGGGWSPWLAWEDQWDGTNIGYYYEENENPVLGTPYWHYFSTRWAPWAPDPTDPDTFFFVRWPTVYGDAFIIDYLSDGRDSIGGNQDDAVALMWVNRTISPGDTLSIVEYIWSPNSPVYQGIEQAEQTDNAKKGLFGPNPVRPGDRLSFAVSSKQTVEIKLYSVDGRLVKTLFNGKTHPGLHAINLPQLRSGTYILVMNAELDGSFTRKIVMKQ